MIGRDALLGHEVLVKVVSTGASSSLVHLGAGSGPPLLLCDRSLVQIARLEELVDGG